MHAGLAGSFVICLLVAGCSGGSGSWGVDPTPSSTTASATPQVPHPQTSAAPSAAFPCTGARQGIREGTENELGFAPGDTVVAGGTQFDETRGASWLYVLLNYTIDGAAKGGSPIILHDGGEVAFTPEGTGTSDDSWIFLLSEPGPGDYTFEVKTDAAAHVVSANSSYSVQHDGGAYHCPQD